MNQARTIRKKIIAAMISKIHATALRVCSAAWPRPGGGGGGGGAYGIRVVGGA